MTFTCGREIPEKLITDLKEKEMFFLGEYVHNDRLIFETVHTLLLDIAYKSGFRLFAKEAVYCLHPHLESCSRNGLPSPYIPEQVLQYNKNHQEKIITTAVDLAHSIKHSPHLVKDYISLMSAGVKSEDFQRRLAGLTDRLDGDSSLEEKRDFIQGFKDLTVLLDGIEGPELIEELRFYGDLLETSLDNRPPADEKEYKARADIRNKWFIRTIGRAMERNRGLKPVCYVGAPHAYKSYLKEDDYYAGKTPEAMHFNRDVFPDKVFSLLIRPFFRDYYGNPAESITDPVEQAAWDIPGPHKTVYVDLKGEERGRQFDGILYLKEKQTSL